MKRWLLWLLVAPQAFLLAGLWRDVGLPPLDMSVLSCLFLALFADRAALPVLVLTLAMGRTLVDDASLPVQILVLGVPVAVLLPLRGVLYGRPWVWQVAIAALCAVAIPKLGGLCGRLFDQPSANASLQAMHVVWSALLLPPLLAVLRRLPPCRAFVEVE